MSEKRYAPIVVTGATVGVIIASSVIGAVVGAILPAQIGSAVLPVPLHTVEATPTTMAAYGAAVSSVVVVPVVAVVVVLSRHDRGPVDEEPSGDESDDVRDS